MSRGIKTKIRRLEAENLEVISDIGGVEEISPCDVELFFPLFLGRDTTAFHAADICDHLKEVDRDVGLRHAESLLKVQGRLPEEWKKYFLLFPGTVLRVVHGKKLLYMPSLTWTQNGGWVIYYYLIWRRDWSRDKHAFIRMKR